VPLTSDGRSVPTSGTVGANVTPGPSDGSGLTTRPGYVPGPAGDNAVLADGYRVGVRAPWGILLDDRPAPAPVPVPGVNPADGNGLDAGGQAKGDNGKSDAGNGNADKGNADNGNADNGNADKGGLPAEAPSGDGPVILADAGPAWKSAAGTTPAPPDVFVPPGQAKKAAPDVPVSSSISFPALLSVMPPATDEPTVNGTDKPGNGPKSGDDATTDSSAGQSKTGSTQGNGKDAKGSPGDITLPISTDTAVPSVTVPAVPGAAPQTSTSSQQPQTSNAQTSNGQHSKPQPSKPQHPSKPQPATPTAKGWHIDGLSLSSSAPAATGKGGSPAFRKALKSSLHQRPDSVRPGPAALRRWAASLQKAASLAPDARTKQQLRVLAQYANELASTPAAKRASIQPKHRPALDAAAALRAAMPRRFGVDLLG
jgi:hypothetical protein